MKSLSFHAHFTLLGHPRVFFGEQYDPSLHDVGLIAGIGICVWNEQQNETCNPRVTHFNKHKLHLTLG